jgi:hypothetical protein
VQVWHEFYEMIGGAAATLLGLLFVSVSLNAEIILGPSHKHAKRLAEQAFQNYLAVLIVSLVMVFPGGASVSLGYTLLWISGVWGIWAVTRAVPALREARSRESWGGPLRRYFATLIGFASLLYAAYRMITGDGPHLEFVAIGVMLLLIAATTVSWNLLINIAEQKYQARSDSE